MKITKQIISTEVMIIKSQISIARSNVSNAQKISETLKVAQMSPLFSDSCTEWICDQILNNELPENSSGSYITALGDIDNLICGLDIEENEELCNYAKSILIF
tara:strand:+ start:9611 stop:9919 length:309 start_codon:yes stop_codon:yes gene_type:complete